MHAGSGMSLEDLETRGWTQVQGVSDRTGLVDLANKIGNPVAAPTGELVREIRAMPAVDTKTGSLTATFGTGRFPLHTDTAFWPIPARYLVMRVHGDVRRPTTVRSFQDLFRRCPKHSLRLAEESTWLVRTPSTSFYSSMLFRCAHQFAWRYDRNCMFPVNAQAVELAAVLVEFAASDFGEPVSWFHDSALVLSNWAVLHGRGAAPNAEGVRVLERIYVR